MLSQLPLDRRRPRHKPEAEPVINHREAAGDERKPLSIDASYFVAFRSFRERQSGLGREPSAKCVHLAIA